MSDIHARISRGINRARLTLEVRRAVRPALVTGLCVVLGVALAAYIVGHVSKTTFAKTYEARFRLRDATGVVPGVDEVRFKGVPVGTITDVAMQGDGPVITVKIQSKYRHLYRDVRAELRPSTALQDMFLDIVDRGTPTAGRLAGGDAVPAVQTQTPVNVSDVLNVFGPQQRTRLRTLLADLGNGMADRGESLKAIFVEGMPFIRSAGAITRQLREQAPLLRELVRDTSLLTGELGAHEAQLRSLVTNGATTLGALQESSADLDATVRELPPTVSRVQSSFATLRGVLGDTDGAVRSLYPVADKLSSSLAEIRRLNAAAAPAVAALQRPVKELVPLSRQLDPVAAKLDESFGLLRPWTHTVEKVTDDLKRCKRGFQGFFQWNVSMNKFGDARGPVPRGNVVMGAQSSGLLNDPFEFAPQACTPGKIVGNRPPTAKDRH